jgi:LuxR family maltose regulon positive regulatory protein
MKPADLPKAVRIIDHLHSRYLKASGQFDRALTILDELERICRQDAYYRRLMSVQVTQALIYQQQGKQNDAQTTFESALRMAAPEGYRAMFIPHETRPTRSLLQSSRHVSPDFVDSILNLAEMAPEEPQPAAALLVDPLTDQELTVVGLLAEGKSNQEIADELVISVGTAKWHVHNILGKLDVSNRSQAAARAHELKLL